MVRAECKRGETTWSSLYRTLSRPFNKPESGKIAVKVINHYGDEVLKVFEIKSVKESVVKVKSPEGIRDETSTP